MLQRDIPFLREVREPFEIQAAQSFIWMRLESMPIITVTLKWYDCSANLGRDAVQAEAPTGKGRRLIVLHAGYEGGFLPDCSLVSVGKTNFVNYHDEMNGDHFVEWFN